MFSILIVDDSSNIRYYVAKILNSLDIELSAVHEAADGLEAIQKLGQFQYDVVLTDINMPRMNGLELTKHIKNTPGLGDVKVIVISTEGSKELVLESVVAGACGYLKKPFEPEEALTLMNEVLAI